MVKQEEEKEEMKRYNSKLLNNKEYRRLKYMKKIKLKMNKKGNFMMTFIIAVAFFMFGILIIGLLFQDIAITRSSDNLDCSNQTISSGNKISCLEVDSIVPAFIISLVLIGGGAVVVKLIS